MAHRIHVQLPGGKSRSYDIHVGSGLLQSLSQWVARVGQAEQVYVITDSTVGALYGRRVLRQLTSAGLQPIMLDFPAGERSKSMTIVSSLHTRLLEYQVRRTSLIVALGGGVVGDVAGFVAATILRGIGFIQVPTTLLAQVDSSVGGKVGIDHVLGKNLIGAFHQPYAVVIDPDVLRTLPQAEFRSGLAEVVKIAAALDAEFFRYLERNAAAITRENGSLLAKVMSWAIGLKAAVVEKDERESGLRKTLNLGHTLGHAFESVSHYAIRHGEAVSMGLAAEAQIASSMGILPHREYERLITLLRRLSLPIRPRLTRIAEIEDALALDKKADSSGTKFVLLKRMGESVVGVTIPPALVATTLR